MKNDYHDRIERIIELLNAQIDSTHSLQDLANVAQLSPFHFHRIYRAITGETPFGTLRRLRLARAVRLLRDTEKPITEIAFAVGYESSQSFSRAFRRFAGCSATEARADPQKLELLLSESSANRATPVHKKIDVRLVSVDPFSVVADRHVGPPKGLFQAFGGLFEWAQRNFGMEDFRGIYGIPIDDPRDESLDGPRFDCCFDFGPDAKPSGRYFSERLGGGLYAVARHIGSYEGLDEIYDALYGSWLFDAPYLLRDQFTYNHYLADPDTIPESEWETDIYIPVRELSGHD